MNQNFTACFSFPDPLNPQNNPAFFLCVSEWWNTSRWIPCLAWSMDHLYTCCSCWYLYPWDSTVWKDCQGAVVVSWPFVMETKGRFTSWNRITQSTSERSIKVKSVYVPTPYFKSTLSFSLILQTCKLGTCWMLILILIWNLAQTCYISNLFNIIFFILI